jgi:RNA polymerase sigma-70 factor (ECF subfamily)
MAISHPILPESALLARIRAGDAAAFQSLFDEHYRALCVFASGYTGSHAAAEEVVQDVFLRIWQRRERWQVSGPVAAYLYTAVRNHALNEVRRQRVRDRWRTGARRDSPDARTGPMAPSADQDVQTAELARVVQRAIDELPPRCREVFLLRRQHELSYAEIAQILGIAPKTVEIHIGVALKALRKKLADWL